MNSSRLLGKGWRRKHDNKSTRALLSTARRAVPTHTLHMAQPETHKDPSTGAETSASQAAAVKKIRELTGNTITHEEAKRLLLECDGDLPVAMNRIADGNVLLSCSRLRDSHAYPRFGVLE